MAFLMGKGMIAEGAAQPALPTPESLRLPNFPPSAKRAIYLFMSGAPPQMDMWDYKPGLAALYDKDLPDSVRGSQALTGMTAGQARFPVAPSHWGFYAAGPIRTLGGRPSSLDRKDGRRSRARPHTSDRCHQS